jgi:hypothetical protein
MSGCMTANFEVITKSKADQLLQKSAGNRNIRPHRLSMYCRARSEDRWKLTHQGICIGSDGKVYDGHHRLHMVSRTGLPTEFLVVRGMPPENAVYIDCGLPRGARDAFKMSGLGNYSEDIISAARVMKYLPASCSTGGNGTIDNAELHGVIEEYAEGLTFACQNLVFTPGVTRGVRALVARAFYHCDSVRLGDFCLILKSGQPLESTILQEEDSAAFRYLKYLSSIKGACGSAQEIERYKKGQSAIRCFMNKQFTSKLYAADEDFYPLRVSEKQTDHWQSYSQRVMQNSAKQNGR